MTSGQVAIDVAFGALCCLSLWWRRRWPFGVALVCVLLGAFSTSGTVAGLLALSSLAVHRHVRPALLVAALFVPSAVVCSIWLGRTNTWSVLLPTAALAAAATAWGMFVRARRQLLSTLRDRAQRAEADQLLRAERARLAERTRIAREMHDVLAHRISLVALHAGALEVALDLPPAQVRESAALLRLTAHQALEELRDVIGVLREEPGQERPSTVPQPTLADIPRLVEETRRSGAKIDFEMRVDGRSCRTRPLGSRRLPHRAGSADQHRQARPRHPRPGSCGGRAEQRPARQRSEPTRSGRPRPSGSAGFRRRPAWSAGASDPGQWRPGARTGRVR